MSDCPCGSGKEYEKCCAPAISGEQPAQTAEALMRSRYSAYSKMEIEYLNESLHPDHRHDHDLAATRRWAENSSWENLEVRSVEKGEADDDEGIVEFIATFKEKGVHRKHHERARFQKVDGRWYYLDGEFVAAPTQRKEGPKVGRNEPCPCGSGKKYKKCCGA